LTQAVTPVGNGRYLRILAIASRSPNDRKSTKTVFAARAY
jgi:hypothetical protein